MIFTSLKTYFSLLPGIDILSSVTTSIDPVTLQQSPELAAVGASQSPCVLNFPDGAQIQISYDTSLESIKYLATVPIGHYHAIGYGSGMDNTNMVAWFTNSTGPQQIDLYSVTYQPPDEVFPNSYLTTWINATIATVFQTTRTLAAQAPDTYTIPLGTPFPIVWAWSNTDFVSFHSDNAGTEEITLLADGSCILNESVREKSKPTTVHGYLMTFAWTFLSIFQVYTARYLKHWWRHRHLMHAFSGGIAGIFTLVGFVIVMKSTNWEWI